MLAEAGRDKRGEERPREGPRPQLGWSPAWLSQQLPGEPGLVDRSHVHPWPEARPPWSAAAVAQPQGRAPGSPPTPYLGVHRGHSSELHAEHALVTVHPAHARQRHLQEERARWGPARPPALSALSSLCNTVAEALPHLGERLGPLPSPGGCRWEGAL